MLNNRMIILGAKESFIIRVLQKKVQSAGCECDYLPLTVDAINDDLRDAPLISLYIDEEEKPHGDVLHFLVDLMEEKSIQVILIGEKDDIPPVAAQIPEGLIYRDFVRPVDNEA